MKDLPAFTTNTYATTSNRADRIAMGVFGDSVSDNMSWSDGSYPYKNHNHMNLAMARYNASHSQEKQSMAVNGKAPLRVVRVFLVDPDERVPVDKRILYRSEEMTTDATDQELFFGIQVNDLLKTHNTMRAGVEWEEKTSEGTKSKTGLKEARIRDLVMSVTTVASFASVAP